MIYHIIAEADWHTQLQEESESISVSTLQTEGFIHCCTQQQVEGVLSRYFKGQTGLLMLEIDESKLQPGLRFEKSTNDELFPHVYGAINKSAIVKVERIT
ncbi:MAG: DUF952 domain-containing protein [Cyclobacteriaceae bacterium]|nr:DUF952 domain-containing protein [Cyclobacteriaceae bacterium]